MNTPVLGNADNIQETMIVRDSADRDIDAIQAIYAHEVLHGLATFEVTPPATKEMLSRRDGILNLGLPFLVAEINGAVMGYSYASAYRPRAAYRHTIEDSVYVAQQAQRCGIGARLLGELIARCAAGPWRQMLAVIGNSGNLASIALHQRLGFRTIGTLTSVGFKFDQWVDTVLMQRELDHGNSDPTADNS